MSTESVSATRTLAAPARAVFAVLTDPTNHADVDGTGWVTAAVDVAPLAAVGDLFRMSMHHQDQPGGAYETVNEVVALEDPWVIAWRTGHVESGTQALRFAGWWWRYDLAAVGARRTTVTLTFDWSQVGPGPREYLSFPVFADGHLEGSLRHLADLVAGG